MVLIPEDAWEDAGIHPLYSRLSGRTSRLDRLRRDVLRAIHDHLPEDARAAIVDTIMEAESYGTLRALAIGEQADPAIGIVLQTVLNQAQWYGSDDGTSNLLIPASSVLQLTPTKLTIPKKLYE